MDTSNVKAFIFDVFGTVVDWRGSIIEQCENFGRVKGIEADWGLSPTPGEGSTAPT